jgi:hypothetical protein
MRKQTRSWSRSAVRVRSSALFFPANPVKNEKLSMLVSGALSAVDSIPKDEKADPLIPSTLCGSASYDYRLIGDRGHNDGPLPLDNYRTAGR